MPNRFAVPRTWRENRARSPPSEFDHLRAGGTAGSVLPTAYDGRPARPGAHGRPAQAACPAKGQAASSGQTGTEKKKLEEKRIKAFRDYFDYREEIKKIPPASRVGHQSGRAGQGVARKDRNRFAGHGQRHGGIARSAQPSACRLSPRLRPRLLIAPDSCQPGARGPPGIDRPGRSPRRGRVRQKSAQSAVASAGAQSPHVGPGSRLQKRLQTGRPGPVRQPAGTCA